MISKVFVLSILCFLLSIASPTAIAQEAKEGELKVVDLLFETPLVIYNDVTLVPVREVSEFFGISIELSKNAIILRKGDIIVELQKGRQVALINSQKTALSAPVMELRGKIYVPLRLFELAFKADVKQPGKAGTIFITLDEKKARIKMPSSETLTVNAWESLEFNDRNAALLYAQTCIRLYNEEAQTQQKAKRKRGGLINWQPGDPEEKKKQALSYWALNDVAACWFIIGKIRYERGDKRGAQAAFREIKSKYSLAEIWDPRGWFWNPVTSIKIEFPDVDP